MYQVTFSDQSMAELNKLSIPEQMKIVEVVSAITPRQLHGDAGAVGRFNRAGNIFYRVRAGEFRCYFTVSGDVLYSHYILHRNTFMDFAFRFKLPVTEEQILERHQSFWKYLETLKK